VNAGRQGRRIGAIGFDLDGTLLDTANDIAAAINAMLAEFGRDPLPLEWITDAIGQGLPVLVSRVLTEVQSRDPSPPIDAALALTIAGRTYAEHLTDTTVAFPGVHDGLKQLQAAGYQLACITNKPERYTRPLLARQDLLACFACVVAGDTTPHRKPHPEPLWHACQELAIPAYDWLYVGDSGNDVAAARAAGIPVWILEYGYREGATVAELGADRAFATFPDLVAALVGTRRPIDETNPC
jgi:phosphoglycolate phosphatase